MAYHGKKITLNNCIGSTIYLTRKDWRHKEPNNQGFPESPIKAQVKKHCNKKVRLYKGEISQGGAYKKIEDLQYTIH